MGFREGSDLLIYNELLTYSLRFRFWLFYKLSLKSDVDILERVQQRATEMIKESEFPKYAERAGMAQHGEENV